MKRALSRHLGELGTVSSSSHALGKFVSKNNCKFGLLPPTWSGNRSVAQRSRPRFQSHLNFSQLSTAIEEATSCRVLTSSEVGSDGLHRLSWGSSHSGHFPPCILAPLCPSNWLVQVRLVWLISTCKLIWLIWTLCGRLGQGVVCSVKSPVRLKFTLFQWVI